MMNNNTKTVLEYLEQSYTGARMMDDADCMIRTARAIEAFNLSTSKDCIIEEKERQDSVYCPWCGKKMSDDKFYDSIYDEAARKDLWED